jgi:hypothetical protein
MKILCCDVCGRRISWGGYYTLPNGSLQLCSLPCRTVALGRLQVPEVNA